VPKYDIRLSVWLTTAMAADVDDWRRVHPAPPTRPEAIRQLAEAGLHVFSPEMIDSLDRWARDQPDNPDWPEAARRLLIEVLRR
jgi:hypothetical protein